MWHGYFGIENVNLNASQRQALVEALRTLGPASNRQPCRLIHWRTRLDDDAAIFEALFNEDTITVEAFKNRLGNIFVSPASIDHSTNRVTLDARETAVVTFSRNSTDYLRVAFFGYAGDGDWPTWNESRIETLAYLQANREEWESDA
jgi:hypothetical protein